MRPRLSVIIPCHRWDKYAVQAIESLLSDTSFSPQHHEVIFVANGEQIVSDLDKIRTLPFIHIIYRHEANISIALNAGLDEASGNLIVRFDADDLWIDGRFGELTKISLSNNLFGSHCNYMINEDGIRVGIRTSMRETKRFIRRPFRSLTTHPCVFFSAALISQTRYKPEYAGIEDIIFMHELLSKEDPEIIFIDKPLISYRTHYSQTTAKNLNVGKIRLARYYYDKLYAHERVLLKLYESAILRRLWSYLLLRSLRYLSW